MNDLEEIEELLPTGRPHLSYSEVKTWLDCGWMHKLVHIDKLSKFEPSIFSDFGSIIHDACENYLQTRVMEKERAFEKIREIWEKRGYPDVEDWPDYESAVPDLDYWLTTADNMLSSVPDFLDEQFPGWKCHSAEERFKESVRDEGIKFKGFIDGVLVVEKKGKPIYWIIDWKTAKPGGWHPSKRRDTKVLLQLVLYKYFWAQKNDIPLKDIRCAFVLLRRDEPDPAKRKKGGNRCSILKVSAGPKTIDKAMKQIRNMIVALRKELFLKNRTSCTFCEFQDTEHCKRW